MATGLPLDQPASPHPPLDSGQCNPLSLIQCTQKLLCYFFWSCPGPVNGDNLITARITLERGGAEQELSTLRFLENLPLASRGPAIYHRVWTQVVTNRFRMNRSFLVFSGQRSQIMWHHKIGTLSCLASVHCALPIIDTEYP